MKPEIKIDLLKNYPELIVDAATLWYNNLGSFDPDHSLESALEMTQKGIAGENEKWSITVLHLMIKRL